MKRSNKERLVLFTLFLIGLLLMSVVDARSAGKTGQSTAGCTCHDPSPSSDVTVSIQGIPEMYIPKGIYPLNISIDGGPPEGGMNKGGFNLKASAGVLSVPTGSDLVQIIDGEATHTRKGNDMRRWEVDWTAPSAGSGAVDLNVAGNSVNGDGTNSGDRWNKAVYITMEALTSDTEDPLIEITEPIDGATFEAGTISINVSGTASDNMGLTTIEICTDNVNWTQLSVGPTWSTTLSVVPKNNTIIARAIDRSSNVGNETITIFVMVLPPEDDEAPNLIIASPSNGTILPVGSTTVGLSGTASDNRGIDKVEVTWDGSFWIDVKGTTDWTATISVETGNNTITVRASDAAGNEALAKLNVTVDAPIEDPQPPKLSITAPAQGEEFPINTTSILIEGSATDDLSVDRVEVSKDMVRWEPAFGSTSWNVTIAVVEGNNTVHLRAFDISGNSVIASVTFHVKAYVPPPPSKDTTPPVLTIITPTDGKVFPIGTMEVLLSGTASDANGIKEVYITTKDVNHQPASGNLSWSYSLFSISGHHTVTVVAKDPAGNIDSKKVSFEVLADDEKPELTIQSHSGGIELEPGTGSIVVSGSASDNDGVSFVEVSTDNEKWLFAQGTESWSRKVYLKEGSNIIYVKATDHSGNEATSSIEVDVPKEERSNWILHPILLVTGLLLSVPQWISGYMIRRDTRKGHDAQKRRRRKLHILMGPPIIVLIVLGFVLGLLNHLNVRGVYLTSAHGLLAMVTLLVFIIGGSNGLVMAFKGSSPLIHKVHKALMSIGPVLLGLTMVLGLLFAFNLGLL